MSGLCIEFDCFAQVPQAEISNGLINARFYLPDSVNGYYRGSRFDWSGVIPDLHYKGHSFYGKWFQKYDPKLHDAIMGPVNEFSPLGYSKAKPGESFVKIGVGVLLKLNDSKYSFMAPYKILNYGNWEIEQKSNQIVFNQKLNDKNFSYKYTKTVILPKGKSEMLLQHSIENTGKKKIETSVYNHNFLMIDKQLIGPEYVTEFPFSITSKLQEKSNLVKIEDNRIIFQKDLRKNEYVYFSEIHGFGDDTKDHQIIVANQNSGAGVKITGDRPLLKLAFWSASTTICPEPYIEIKINPGETFRWQISYTFFTIKNGNQFFNDSQKTKLKN